MNLALFLVCAGIAVTVLFLLLGLIGLVPHFSGRRLRRLEDLGRVHTRVEPWPWVAAVLQAIEQRFPWRRARAERVLREQFQQALLTMVGSLEAGGNTVQALAEAHREVPEPLAGELAWVLGRYESGLPLSTALGEMERRLAFHEATHFVRAVRLAMSAGGNLKDILSGLAASLEERRELMEEMRARSVEARVTAWIMALLPLVLTAYLVGVRPEVLRPLLVQGLGRMGVMYAVVSWVVGVLVVHRLVSRGVEGDR